MGALRRLVREAAGAVLTDLRDEAVAVEDVVDDLEQQAELACELTPGLLLGRRDLGGGERAADRRREQRSGLQAVKLVQLALAANVEPLAADHRERCVDELARHGARAVRERETER